MKLRALAKINLGLDVTGKRPDGYHEEIYSSLVYIFAHWNGVKGLGIKKELLAVI